MNFVGKDFCMLNSNLFVNFFIFIILLISLLIDRKKMNLKFFLFFLCFALQNVSSNLLWGGDFQFYNGTFSNGSEERIAYINSQLSLWYLLDMSQIEIKIKKFFPTTVCVDLSNIFPNTLCQNVSLTKGKKYQLDFSLFCEHRIQNITLYAYLNQNIISSLYIKDSNSFNESSISFIAQQAQNQICFNETHSPAPAYLNSSWLVAVGGMIDNITLIQVQILTQPYQLNFRPIIQQIESMLILQSDMNCNQTIIGLIGNQYTVSYKNETLNTFDLRCTEENKVQISISLTETFYLSYLQFVKKNSTSIEKNLKITYEKIDKYFHYLDKNQKENYKNVKGIVVILYTYIGEFSNYLKYGFCSYFMVTLFSFQNLSLLYIFLQIRLVPQFTKQIYHQLLQIYFYFDNFSNLVNRMFKLSTNIFQMDVEVKNIPQIIDKYNGTDEWFGYYQISSLFIKNNADNFIVLALLGVKLLILKLVIRCLGKKIKRQFGVKTEFKIVFFVQFIGMIPSFILSSIPRVLNGSIKTGQMLQKSLQALIWFACLNSVFFYFVHVNRVRKRLKYHKRTKQKQEKSQQNKKIIKVSNYINKKQIHRLKLKVVRFNLPKSKRSEEIQSTNLRSQTKNRKQDSEIKNFTKKNYYHRVTDILLIITIPTLIVIGQVQTFFFIVTIILVIKWINFFKYIKSKSPIIRILQFFISSTWSFHHIVFVILHGIGKVKEQDSAMDSCEAIIVLGLMAILTVILGCLLQLLKLSVCCIKICWETLKITKKIWNIHCGKKNQVKSQSREQDEPKLQQRNNQKEQEKQFKLHVLENDHIRSSQIEFKKKKKCIKNQRRGIDKLKDFLYIRKMKTSI